MKWKSKNNKKHVSCVYQSNLFALPLFMKQYVYRMIPLICLHSFTEPNIEPSSLNQHWVQIELYMVPFTNYYCY